MKDKHYVPVSYFPGNQKSADGGILRPFGPILDGTLTANYLSSETSKDGKEVLVILQHPVADTSVHPSQFRVKVGNVVQIPAAAMANSSGDTLWLTLANQIVTDNAVVTLSYEAGSLLTTDSLSVTSFYAKAVTNKVASPKFVSATTSDDGATILIKLSESMGDPSAEIANFEVTISGTPISVTKAELLSTDDHYVVLTVNPPVVGDSEVRVSYTPGALSSADGVLATAFSGKFVKNTVSGIDEVNGEEVARVYPNPMNDRLYISNAVGFSFVSITNILGQEMKHMDIPADGQLEINTSNLSNGVYLITLQSTTQRKVYRIVKN